MTILIIIPTNGRHETERITRPAIQDVLDGARKKYGIHFFIHYADDYQAMPLGAKLNTTLERWKLTVWDYVMVLGSDDLIRPQAFGYIATAIDEGLKFFGFNQCVVYDRINERAKLWKSGVMTVGAGRCIHRSIVEQCNWKLWDSKKENGIDASQDSIIQLRAGEVCHIIPTLKPVLCDIKDGLNLNSFDEVEGGELPVKGVLKEFPELNGFYSDACVWTSTATNEV